MGSPPIGAKHLFPIQAFPRQRESQGGSGGFFTFVKYPTFV
jgi:hypothetical protein